jgi:hypothetical protein
MKTLKPLFLTLLLGMTTFTLMAQSTPPPPPAGAPPGFPLPYIFTLALAAVGFGVYKLFNNSKK